MNPAPNPIPEVMHEAAMPSDIVEPKALLATLATVENAIVALLDNDQANGLFEALHSEFGFIRSARFTRSPLQPSEQSRWASLVRWLVRELKTWQPAQDPGNRKLTAIFVVAQGSDSENGLWELMPSDIADNSDLIQALKNLISSFSVNFTTRGGMAEPIWEREALEAFTAADAAGDWVGIGERLRPFEHQLFPSTLLTQVVRCLHRCGMDHLVDALANLRQTVIALHVGSSLTGAQRLQLAVKSGNPYIEFACTYQTLSGRPRG
jgi:hypothetical protein